jgi:hypothetical protein
MATKTRCQRDFVVSLDEFASELFVERLLTAEPLLSLPVSVTSEQRVESILKVDTTVRRGEQSQHTGVFPYPISSPLKRTAL